MTWVDRASSFFIDRVAPRLLQLGPSGSGPSLAALEQEALAELQASIATALPRRRRTLTRPLAVLTVPAEVLSRGYPSIRREAKTALRVPSAASKWEDGVVAVAVKARPPST